MTEHQEGSQCMPAATEHHKWLERFVGEWTTEGEVTMAPGQPPVAITGVEKAYMLGDFWAVGESESDFSGMKFQSRLMFGYDPAKEQYVGSMFDSMSAIRWSYEGTLDESGNLLTLTAQVPAPEGGGKMMTFHDTVEFKSPDHRVYTSRSQNAEGEWQTAVVIHFRRKV